MVKVQVLYICVVLVLLLAPALLSLSPLAGVIGVSPQTPPASSMATTKGDPVAVWSINETSTKSYISFWYPNYYPFKYEVEKYSYTQSASMLYRQYADGTFDNTNFKLYVADEYDGTQGWRCYDQGGNYTGNYLSHVHSSSDDPDRYDGNPNGTWGVSRQQFADGSWHATLSTTGPDDYSYSQTVRENGSDCSGNTWDRSYNSSGQTWHHCTQLYGNLYPGNTQGTEFNGNSWGIVPWVNCDVGPSEFRFVGGKTGIRYLNADITVRLLAARDLTVNRLEVTQGLQDEANSIPLVRGRRTVVRAFLDIGTDPGPVNGVTGVLEGYAGETLLGTVSPFNPNGQINAPSNPDWKNIDDTLNFELPYAWTYEPNLKLTVKVNPDHSVFESNYDNNQLSADVSTRDCQGISIGYAPIHYAPPDGYVPADPSANIGVGQGFMQKIYPVSETGIVYVPRGGITFRQNVNIAPLELLKQLRNSSATYPEHIFGWLPPYAYDGNGRTSSIPGFLAFGNDTEKPDNRWRRTFAHEVGHNLGLEHPDPELITGGAHWFDVYDRVIKPGAADLGGANLFDVMVGGLNEPDAWISPQNYNYLIDNYFCSPAAVTASTESSLPQEGENLIVTGIISNISPTMGTLSPLFRLSTVPASIPPIGSQYCVNLKDAAGNRLSIHCFNQSSGDDSETPSSAGLFSMVIPLPVGLNRVELTQSASGPVLSSQVASAHPPSVTVSFPNTAGLTFSGTQTITWVGSDSDGNPLTYDVLYSRDNGATWIGVGADITETSSPLDFSALPGTNDASGLIKVMVSDGFYSAQDTSTTSFTVGNKPPSASIMSPSAGALFYTGPKIVLEGTGVDLEDGSLDVNALSWVSSKDGTLGAGQLLEVNLSPGDHTITLTVTDSKGLNDTDSIQLTVVQSTSNTKLFLPLIIR